MIEFAENVQHRAAEDTKTHSRDVRFFAEGADKQWAQSSATSHAVPRADVLAVDAPRFARQEVRRARK